MSEDAWKTPAIREAEAALDRSVSKSQQLLKELDKIKLPPVEDPATPERIAALKAAASRPDAPAHLRLIKRKVDAGELRWEDVAAGRAFADPEVRALAMAQLGDAQEMYQELREGATPEEVLEAHTGGSNDLLEDTGRPAYTPPPAAPDPSADPLGRTTPPPPPPSPARHRAADPDDGFADPLADDRPSPPPSLPSSPPPRKPQPRRPASDPVDDDDYFNGNHLHD